MGKNKEVIMPEHSNGARAVPLTDPSNSADTEKKSRNATPDTRGNNHTRTSTEKRTPQSQALSGKAASKEIGSPKDPRAPRKKKSILSTIGTVASGIITGFLLVLIAVLIVALFSKDPSDNGVSIGSYKLLSVASGSMRPTFDENDAILIKKVPPEDLKVGDVITYQPPGSALYTQVTHRIVEIVDGTERFGEPLAFVTRGDSNRTNDAQPRPASRIVGKYVLHIPKLGGFLNYAATTRGIVVTGVIFVAYCFLEVIIKEYFKLSREKKYGPAPDEKDADASAEKN